jgi:hypothetical protein
MAGSAFGAAVWLPSVKARNMHIQDIEDMRRQCGIDDPTLQDQIRGLRRGDVIRLTLLAEAPSAAAETLRVRITSVRAGRFRGKLTSRPASAAFSGMEVGSSVAFTAAHIHSVSGARPAGR